MTTATKTRKRRKPAWHSWIRNERDEKAVRLGYTFDEAAAERVREFFSTFLRHTDGEFAGKPFDLLDWQYDDFIGPVFGWKRPDGRRRYSKAYVEIPKKNGKSTLLGGLGLYLLVADNEPGAQVYILASDRPQAGIIYRAASSMAQEQPALASRLLITDSQKIIGFPDTHSFLRALSADGYRQEGLNASAVLFDELHAQPDRRLYDTMKYAGRARRQPLHVDITTAGYDRHSICYEQHDYAEKVLANIIEDLNFLPVIYAADDDDDWGDPAVWAKANPSLGHTITLESIEADYNEARQSPAKENAFRRYTLNQWTEQAVRWIQMDKWDACGDPLDEEALVGRPCYVAIDLASNTDIAAATFLFPLENDKLVLMQRFWIPADNARERERRDRVPYVQWAKEGLITMTEGDVIDQDVIRRDINQLAERFEIKRLAIDRWNATQITTQLQADGFDVQGFGQGFASMAAPTKEFERLLLDERLVHGGNKVLRWMASNVAVRTDAAGNLKPDKEKSSEKIDGIVTDIMAVGLWAADNRPSGSVYDERGIEWL